MGAIDTIFTLFFTYYICNRVSQTYPNILIPLLSVFVVSLLMVVILVSIQFNFVESENRNVVGALANGLVVSLFGSVIGAWSGRKEGIKRASEILDDDGTD